MKISASLLCIGTFAMVDSVTSAIVLSPEPLLIQTPGPLVNSFTRPNTSWPETWGHVARVNVGPYPVAIGGIGFFGKAMAATSLSYVVYENVDNSLPVLRTDAVDVGSSGMQWFDSGSFGSPLILNANSTYYVGFIVDTPENSMRAFYNESFLLESKDAKSISQNGLTLVATDQEAANPRGSFENPRLALGSSTVQLGVRIYGIPEPGTSLLLFMLGPLLCTYRRRNPV